MTPRPKLPPIPMANFLTEGRNSVRHVQNLFHYFAGVFQPLALLLLCGQQRSQRDDDEQNGNQGFESVHFDLASETWWNFQQQAYAPHAEVVKHEKGQRRRSQTVTYPRAAF
jgi:hypothetical protein